MLSLNPLLEREWRGRFRSAGSYWIVASVVVLVSAVICLAIWYEGQKEPPTPYQWLQNGQVILHQYQWMGCLIFWSAALLIGASTVADEKSNVTWDDLLLCSMGGRGVAIGKIASGTAYVLLIQLALLPILLVAGQCFGIKPTELAEAMVSHLPLSVQGVTLGVWGAARANSLPEGLLTSLITAVKLFLRSVFLLALMGFSFGIVLFIVFHLSAIPTLLPITTFIFSRTNLYFISIARILCSLFGGLTGVGVILRSYSLFGLTLAPEILLLGQLLSIALMVKWTAWQINHPTHDFESGTDTDKGERRSTENWRVLCLVWQWDLTHRQVDAFPLYARFRDIGIETKLETDVVPGPLASQLLAHRQNRDYNPIPPPKREAVTRMRVPIAPFLARLNPILWLDLIRLLSLRTPDTIQIPLLFIASTILFFLLKSLSVVLGWVQSASIGTAGDREILREGWITFQLAMSCAALACGPLLGTRSYIIERRSEILSELRLTLLSAGSVFWGKVLSRFIVFALFFSPFLTVVIFFNQNWPWSGGASEPLTTLLSVLLLAVWSLMVCLCISATCRNEFTTALSCGSFAISWGFCHWEFPEFPWTILHLIGIAIAMSYLFWRLKRLGFS